MIDATSINHFVLCRSAVSLHALCGLVVYRVGQKPDLFKELITSRYLMAERRIICQKFPNFVQQKNIASMSVNFKYSCLVCINSVC